MDLPSPAFELVNPDADGPVVLSVPHAGRDYTAEHRSQLRPPVERIAPLEDRLVDQVARAQGLAPTLIARLPRSWIDLNRHEAEIDPGLVEGAIASRMMLTPKVRSGLGLIPRRLAGIGDIWRRRLSLDDVNARIAAIHRPYHAAVAQLLDRALSRYGIAILIDLHSMPPLPRQHGQPAPRIVIGNRFGNAAAPWMSQCVGAACSRFGLNWRENSPYAGGHIVERHGAPARGVHAIQLELDRSLYLDCDLEQCDPTGLTSIRAFLDEVITGLNAQATDSGWPMAAE